MSPSSEKLFDIYIHTYITIIGKAKWYHLNGKPKYFLNIINIYQSSATSLSAQSKHITTSIFNLKCICCITTFGQAPYAIVIT